MQILSLLLQMIRIMSFLQQYKKQMPLKTLILSIAFISSFVASHCALRDSATFVMMENEHRVIFVNDDGSERIFAACGGINAAQFCNMDLNHDTFDDIVIFDRIGNRMIPLIYNNVASTKPFPKNIYDQYVYTPEYRDSLPRIENWIITRDYDADGLQDIFTYTIGGIKVYRNTSSNHTLSFEEVTKPFLRSYYNNVYTNILVTSVDYPGILDVDKDGDLDIFVFGALGAFVEFHKNLSIEKYNRPDSLLFYKTSSCWGHFAESEESNKIYLDTCNRHHGVQQDGNGDTSITYRHTGSTFLFFDYNNDGCDDLLLGDVDYPNPCMLTIDNLQNMYVKDYTFDFPPEKPIHVFSFPVGALTDMDFDGNKELIISTFDPDYHKSSGNNSVLMYTTLDATGTDFSFVTDSFLQDGMIDVGTGAFPIFFDYDNDGATDMFIGNYGYCDTCFTTLSGLRCNFVSQISYHKNSGTNEHPVFTLKTDDFGNISSYNMKGLFPAFADIDGDNDFDLVCGDESGNLSLFQNNGGTFQLTDGDFLGLSSLNLEFTAPVFYDVDHDGDNDLIIGNSRGTLICFIHDDATHDFLLADTMWGGVDVRDEYTSWTGHSIPCLFSYHDTTLLIVGSESGKLFLYDNIDDNIDGLFEQRSVYDVGNQFRSSPSAMVAADTCLIAVGTFSGGINIFDFVRTYNTGTSEYTSPDDLVIIWPNPVASGETLHIGTGTAHAFDHFCLFDANGYLVLSKDIYVGDNEISLASLRRGVYVYRIFGSESVYGKIVIQ